MTEFVLVPGAHTGAWVWAQVAEELRASGASVVTPDAPWEAGGPGDGLEDHIGRLVQLIDRAEEPEVVLVGHDYGVLPVLGAAGRRPGRVSRVVHVDTGVPADGDPPLALLTDPGLEDRMDGGAPVPPPAPGRWSDGGSTDGVPPDALAELERRAVPQPAATLTRPLRIASEARELPCTAVLCVRNGFTLAAVERVVGFGDPRYRSLLGPQASFFELDTGHWPMLSRPRELARVLLGAVAGEGSRLSAEVTDPPHLRPFLLDLPGRPRERHGALDLYLPDADDGPRPAVLFVHGGPVPAGVEPTPRDWPALTGCGRYAAEEGLVGAVVDHGLHDLDRYPEAADDVAAALDRLRAHPRVDGGRVALWFFSGGGLLSARWLAAPPPWLRCLAANYPILAPLPGWGPVDARFRPAEAVRSAGRLPLVLMRPGREQPDIAATVAGFVAAAERAGAALETVDVPSAHHGMETVDHTDEARDGLARVMRSVLSHLAA